MRHLTKVLVAATIAACIALAIADRTNGPTWLQVVLGAAAIGFGVAATIANVRDQWREQEAESTNDD